MKYEKKYKEALERAKKMCTTLSDKAISEYIFPELKESDDERIKNEIKVILANTDLSQFALDYTFADMASWLEKQGEKQQGKSALEAIKEEKADSQNCVKTADNVEPKFKVGD